MNHVHYVGFDVHKKTTSFCVKTAAGETVEQGVLPSRREALEQWCRQQTTPWVGALEATLFSGWIYDVLRPHAVQLEMADPRKLEAITAAKKKTDRIDAALLANLLRCHLLPRCWVAPPETRELRRLLRYRNLMVREAVRMKNRTAGLLLEVGAVYNKEKLHGRQYFHDLVAGLDEVPASVIELLRHSRAALEMFTATQRRILERLRANRPLRQRVALLETIPGVGEITALSWALEVGSPERFPTARQAASYCGLTAAFRISADHRQRGPISKQRNAHLQTVLIEAAKLAPRWNPVLAEVRQRERQRGHRNRATLAVARKLVAYLLAIDRSRQPFQMPETETATVATTG